MRIDIEYHARGLLEHLGQSDENEVADYLEQNEIDTANGLLVVEYLVEAGLAEDCSTFGGPDCRLTGSGLARAQQLLAERKSPARRLGTLWSRMLRWLEDNRGVADWSGFLAGDGISYPGGDFTEAEVKREAAYLLGHGLIEDRRVDQADDGTVSPTITTAGRDCLIHFRGDVNQYLNRGGRSTTSHTTHNNTTITMTDSVGNITNASSNVQQNLNSGLDTTEVLKFAGAVRQTLPVLGLNEEVQQAVDAQAEELHQEASAAAPNRGRMRTLADNIMQALQSAGPTIALEMITGLGMQAIQALGG
ncbi:hypothetical protein SAMN05216553_110296 [Lentzea fradiae]|uniref:Uncharacterized protein n=1 Tax=Lentzea fradiae TaxID=200378 RepID=A0A1G7WCK7_9PSEU|nr:hypothetical protein [Lentzea fradiae]SDG69745.1 hypothetical protein SAMN05216553_110296 [Lentzea fradiae]